MPIHTMEPQSNVNQEPFSEFERGMSVYLTAHTIFNNFKIRQEDEYRLALPLLSNAVRKFESATKDGATQSQIKIAECLVLIDPATWGLKGLPLGIELQDLPEIVQVYLKEKIHTPVPSLPLDMIAECKNSLLQSPKSPSAMANSRGAASTSTSERSELNSGSESPTRSLRKQISGFFQGKGSPLRQQTSTERELESKSPEKASPLRKNSKPKDFK